MFKPVDPEMAIAVAAGATALISLLISVWQGLQARKHNELSVRPFLTMERFLPGVGGRGVRQCGIRISNKGTGPAIIKGFGIRIDGEDMEEKRNDWEHATKRLGIADMPIIYVILNIDDALAAGETRWLLEITQLAGNEEKVKVALPRLNVSVEYRSIYGTKATLKNLSSESVSPTQNLRAWLGWAWLPNWPSNREEPVEL